MQSRQIMQATNSATLADILERVLDKGVVIAGDIRVNLVNVELLSIQIRLVICSVDKAREIGLDWWTGNAAFANHGADEAMAGTLERIDERLARLEQAAAVPSGP
jgi:hypothetical protein